MTIIEAAIEIAQGGIEVFPVHIGATKKPLTRRGQHTDRNWSATTDPAHIRQWPPATNAIGMPTGNGRVVIDIDSAKGGERDDAWPETFTVRTRSGGLHLHYWTSAKIRNSASRLAPHVDVRGEGGYVVIPPTPGYEELGGPFTQLPDWLVEQCGRHRGYGAGLAESPKLVPLGERNAHLTDLAVRFVRGGIVDPAAIERYLSAEYTAVCQPPGDPPTDLTAIARWAVSTEIAENSTYIEIDDF